MSNLIDYKLHYKIAGLLAGLGCIVMILFPEVALRSAEKGVSLWASSVLPALLPFFICTNFMTRLGIPFIIGDVFEMPFRKIFGAPGVSAFIFTVSITSGYPMGSKLIGDMGRAGQITKPEARQMLTFCSTSGPLFMLGAVGVGMLSSPIAGAIIAVSHYFGAICNGIFYRMLRDIKGFFDRKNKKVFNNPKVNNPQEKHVMKLEESILDLFTLSILSSLKSLGIICGYIVLFTMMTDFIVYAGIFDRLAPVWMALGKGIFEMTVGCNSLATTEGLTFVTTCILCSFLISFGGLSIMAQSLSMMRGVGISSFYYLKVKVTHGLFSLGIALLLSQLAIQRNLVQVGNMMDVWIKETIVSKLDGFYCLFFSTKMIIMVLIVFTAIFLINNLLNEKNQDIKETKEK